MLTTIGDKKIRVGWNHENYAKKAKETEKVSADGVVMEEDVNAHRRQVVINGRNVWINARTICVLRSEDDTIIAQGDSHCSIMDNFCKSTGRKRSLARAIKDLTREERTQIWEDYRNRGVSSQEEIKDPEVVQPHQV